jgi:hypothetical protein
MCPWYWLSCLKFWCYYRFLSQLFQFHYLHIDYSSNVSHCISYPNYVVIILSPSGRIRRVSYDHFLPEFSFTNYTHLKLYKRSNGEVTIYLSIYLSVCLSVYLSIYLSISIYLSLSIYLSISIYIYISISVCLSACLSICLSVYLSIYLFSYLSISIYLCVCLYIYVYLSIYLSTYLPNDMEQSYWKS